MVISRRYSDINVDSPYGTERLVSKIYWLLRYIKKNQSCIITVFYNNKKSQVQKAQQCYHVLLNKFVKFKNSAMLSREFSQNNNLKGKILLYRNPQRCITQERFTANKVNFSPSTTCHSSSATCSSLVRMLNQLNSSRLRRLLPSRSEISKISSKAFLR